MHKLLIEFIYSVVKFEQKQIKVLKVVANKLACLHAQQERRCNIPILLLCARDDIVVRPSYSEKAQDCLSSEWFRNVFFTSTNGGQSMSDLVSTSILVSRFYLSEPHRDH